MRFGQYITARREALGFSIRGLARHIEVDATYLSRVESGKYEPPGEDIMARLASVMGEDLNVLLGMAGRITSRLQGIIAKNPKAFAMLIEQLENSSDRVIEATARKVRDGKW